MPADWRDLEETIRIHSDSNHGRVGPNLESKPSRGNRSGARSFVVTIGHERRARGRHRFSWRRAVRPLFRGAEPRRVWAFNPVSPCAVARRYAVVHLDQATDPHHPTGMKRRSVAFRLSKQQLAERDALAADLREKAVTLNAAIAAFNQAIEPFSRAVVEALEDYNEILEKARALAGGVTEAAQDEFDARSERWRGSDEGIKVRSWIEQWEVNLDDIDLEVPEPLTEIDPDEQALEIEDAPPGPTD